MRSLPIILLVVSLAPGLANADDVFSLNNEGSSMLHEVTVSPGETFSVDINLPSNSAPPSLAMRLRASASGVFDVVNANYKPPMDSWSWSLPSAGIDPVTDQFGGQGPFITPVDLGHTTMAMVQVAVDSQAPLGVYTLNLSDIWVRGSLLIDQYLPGTPGPDFIVDVVPEPAGALLLTTGLWLAFRRRCPVAPK